MSIPCICVSGSTITKDKVLIAQLEKYLAVIKNYANWQIEPVLSRNKVDLLLLEISPGNLTDLELIKRLKEQYPHLKIVIIDGNGNRHLVTQAFAYGVKDAFKRPYLIELVVERINALVFGQ